jgi:hypothetical protein
VEWSKLCLFVAGPPLFDTVISIHTRWEAFNTPLRFGPAEEEVADDDGGHSKEDLLMMPHPAGSSGNGSSATHHPHGNPGSNGPHCHHRHVFDAIVHQLKVEYSQLRQGNSKQLLYRMLDEVSTSSQPASYPVTRSVEELKQKN